MIFAELMQSNVAFVHTWSVVSVVNSGCERSNNCHPLKRYFAMLSAVSKEAGGEGESTVYRLIPFEITGILNI